MNKLAERRLELLKMEGMGFSKAEIVKIQAEKWHKTERAIWYDFETRKTWQPLFNLFVDREKARMVMQNRLDYQYRESMRQYLTGPDHVKLAALKLAFEITLHHSELLGLSEEEPENRLSQDDVNLLHGSLARIPVSTCKVNQE